MCQARARADLYSASSLKNITGQNYFDQNSCLEEISPVTHHKTLFQFENLKLSLPNTPYVSQALNFLTKSGAFQIV